MQQALLTFFSGFRPALRYVFWPNPGGATYGSPSMMTLIMVSAALVVLSFVIRAWRVRQDNPVTRRLSRSWSSVSFWFGVMGAILVIARVEQIQFFAMRLWWFLWIIGLGVYLFFQARMFRARHYRVLPTVKAEDPRERYLPGKRK